MSARIGLVTAAVVALELLAAPHISARLQEVTLQYKWTKGETVRYGIAQQNTTAISGIPGMGEMNINQSTTQVVRTTVEEVTADGTTTLRQGIESVKMEMASPIFNMNYDSAKPVDDSNPLNAMLKAVFSGIVGESFTLVMAPTGEIQKVEGLSKIAENVFKNIPNDPAAAGVIDSLKASLSDEGMRSMLGQTFAQFPKRPLKVGETWKTDLTSTNPMLGTITTTVTSTLKAIEGEGTNRVARIATSMVMKPDATKPAAPNAMGLTVKMGDTTAEGEQLFEVGSGRLRRSNVLVNLPMTMSGAGPDGSPLAMTTHVKGTTTVELSEK